MREISIRAGFEFAEGTVTSFALRDPVGREIDVHVARFDEHGSGIYRMQNGEDWVYPAEGFAGKGKIGALQVYLRRLRTTRSMYFRPAALKPL
ncbi:MAG: hypothetical protein ACT4PY_10665 [Armatimonadota bacterium]